MHHRCPTGHKFSDKEQYISPLEEGRDDKDMVQNFQRHDAVAPENRGNKHECADKGALLLLTMFSLRDFVKNKKTLFEEPIKNHFVAIFTSSMQAQIWVGHRSYFIRGSRYRIHTPSDRIEVRTLMAYASTADNGSRWEDDNDVHEVSSSLASPTPGVFRRPHRSDVC
ncbi:PPR repeat [Musa troglodytarum]|uniref:PPR repeat n=1 Tax=Musa troglodytarum TaxID=320322 RepID=A0A9E7G3V9_9LILI|nr:PPR repeat [Musa troglodytarum]